MGEGMKSVVIGTRETYAKTITDYDVYGFAGITGDFHPFHVNEEFAVAHGMKGRMVHGLLTLGYFSALTTKVTAHFNAPAVAYGYDRIRFLKPVFIGDTISLECVVAEKDEEKSVVLMDCRCTNQNGDLVLVARHITKLLE